MNTILSIFTGNARATLKNKQFSNEIISLFWYPEVKKIQRNIK